MIPRQQLPAHAIETALRQQGVLAVSQLRAMGVTPRVLQRLSREWMPLARGIYFLGPPGAPTPWLSRVWAGVLIGGDGAGASHITAAVLNGLFDLDDMQDTRTWIPPKAFRADKDIEILVPGNAPRPRRGYVFHRDRVGTHVAARPGEPPSICVEDTVLDLCRGASDGEVITWLTRGCQRRRTTPYLLLRRLEERPGAARSALIRAVLSDAEAGATTELERRAMHDIFEAHGLPSPQWQHRTRGGGRIVDAFIHGYRLFIEFDGRIGHAGDGAFRDRRRDNEHAVDGAHSLRYGWWETAQEPCACARQIATVLASLGPEPSFVRCPACRG